MSRRLRSVLISLILVFLAPFRAAYGLDAGQTVAIVVTRGAYAHIYLMNEDGSNFRRLTNLTGDEYSPAWSPDGNQIAFAYDDGVGGGIYLADADGKNVYRLTSSASDSHPPWSTDGYHLAVSSWYREFSSTDICILERLGAKVNCLTYPDRNNPHAYLTPRWSPDGNHIAFMAYDGRLCRIYIMGTDGSQVHDANVEAACTGYGWSPDGRQIAYSAFNEGQPQISILDTATWKTRTLDNTSHQDWFLSWSLDGKYIVFSTDRD